MYSIRLLTTSAINKNVLIEACGSDSYIELDKRIKNINTVHEKAFDHINKLKNIRSYAGFNVYQGTRLLQVNKFKGFNDFSYKQI